ncbi:MULTISPECIES: hypothetical protein [unclassified Nostoc]|uniref:hypothetical protein n=1 Tax=unclassified Nostoc TaxID=2593658 RepID=UPI000B9550E3|nr:hypothetical protein [Nostoc sp. 'Peltigera membranacea cyanobiont' 232]OYE01814.1 hypothetical protein CDG79_27345 [Nostoc sp. 'Peltigera membranacea cyanobiont' 232]
MTNNKPKKKTQVFRSGQVEGYEVGLTLEEIECHACGGGGEVADDDGDGNEYTEPCSECDGAGLVYVSID